MDDLSLFNGDNGEIISSDYPLSDFGEVLELVNKMPKLDTKLINYSQYKFKRYHTGCTIMSGINAVASIMNKDYSDNDISRVYDMAEKLGWKPGYGWARGSGWNAVRKDWNERNPDNKMLLFVESLFSDVFEIVMEKLGVVGVSISVDSKYWKDVRDNLSVEGNKFLQSLGHATCMYRDGDYMCLDSIPQGGDISKPMIYKWNDVKGLIQNKNIRIDCHIIIMEKWLQVTDETERNRLIEFRKLVQEAMEINSKLWILTKNDSERDERHRQNQYNKSKITVIDALLSK